MCNIIFSLFKLKFESIEVWNHFVTFQAPFFAKFKQKKYYVEMFFFLSCGMKLCTVIFTFLFNIRLEIIKRKQSNVFASKNYAELIHEILLFDAHHVQLVCFLIYFVYYTVFRYIWCQKFTNKKRKSKVFILSF